MGFLKLLLNVILFWAVYQPCPDSFLDTPPVFEYSENALSDPHENGVVLPEPQILLVKAEDLTYGTDHVLLKFPVPASEDFGFAYTEKFRPKSPTFFHIEYGRVTLFPFHSFL